ncbi:MAG: chemotaxis protein CheX [Phycisphaeraceae bacterium]
MDNSYITPFVRSVASVFETMIQLPVEVGKPALKQDAEMERCDVSGIIGMSGDVEGAIVLSFPIATAERIVTLFTGCELADDELPDAVGELVNMISGGAKAQFKDRQVSISCPSVVLGEHTVTGSRNMIRIIIPCSCDCGEFYLEVALRDVAAETTTKANAESSNAA